MAASFDSPTTFGTVTSPRPFETTTVTVVPFRSLLPPLGLWSMTWPFVWLDSCFWKWGFSPASRIWVSAVS